MKIIGHRGARGLAPENTLASFEKALKYRVDEIELDVRVTKDGLTVLAHDPLVSDPAGNKLSIAQHTLAQLRQHKPDLATLDEAITAIDHRVPIIIEVKPDVPTKPVVRIIKQYLQSGWKPQDFRLGSYSQPILRSLHAELPDIQKIVIEDWSGVRATWRARQVNTRRISMLEYWLWSGFIASMKRRGYELYSFPPKDAHKERYWAKFGLTGFSNNPNKAHKWAKYGLSGVITDYPDRFK